MNEIQTIAFGTSGTSVLSGTITFALDSYTTAPITCPFSASDLQTALQAMDAIFSGNVTVAESSGTFYVTFNVSLGNVSQLTSDASSTLVAVDGTVTQATAGTAATTAGVTPSIVPAGDGTGSAVIWFDHVPDSAINFQLGSSGSVDLNPSMSSFDIQTAVSSATSSQWSASGDFTSSISLIDSSGNGYDTTLNSNSLTYTSVPATTQVEILDLQDATYGDLIYTINGSYNYFFVGDSSLTISGYDASIAGNVATVTAQTPGDTGNTFAWNGSTLTKAATAPTIATYQDGSSYTYQHRGYPRGLTRALNGVAA